jgi:hypothetical protein
VLILLADHWQLLLRSLPLMLLRPLRWFVRSPLLPIRLLLLGLSRLPLLLASGLFLPARRLLRVLIGPRLLTAVVLFWVILVPAIGWPVLRCTRKNGQSYKQRQNGRAGDS